MKLVIVGVIALIVGIAGGAGVHVMTAPPPKLAAAPDTTASHATPPVEKAPGADTTTHAAPVNPTPAPAPAPAPPHDTTPVPAPAGAVTAAAATARAAAVTTATVQGVEGYKQLARIFANMKPVDTAKILAHLDDDQVEGVLRAMNPRQAAALLAELPVERAGRLSKRLIAHPTGADG